MPLSLEKERKKKTLNGKAFKVCYKVNIIRRTKANSFNLHTLAADAFSLQRNLFLFAEMFISIVFSFKKKSSYIRLIHSHVKNNFKATMAHSIGWAHLLFCGLLIY